jgi:hypothetical protein
VEIEIGSKIGVESKLIKIYEGREKYAKPLSIYARGRSLSKYKSLLLYVSAVI